jgi:CheY-like chemotaxis protein
VPSLVILDLGQKSIDAVQVITRLRAEPALRDVPVVGFANHERSDLMEAARQAGCDEVLTRGAFSSGLADLLGRAQKSNA